MNEAFERDQLIERVRRTLRDAPAAAPDARAVGRVLATVWASPRPSVWRRVGDALRMTTFTRLGAAAVAGAALFLGFLSRGAVRGEQAPMAVSTPTTGEMPVAYASNDGGAETALVQTQFVFEESEARSVSLVGDFNQWKAGETPLVRLANGLWTTTVPLPAGRHVYAFMIDDTLLVADPRAPKAGDADFGREGSVVMVFTR
jgi:hypothetical protein